MAKIGTYRFFFGWFFKLIRPVKILGNKNLPTQKVIYCINHTSNWDFIVTLESFKISPVCVYKSEFREKAFYRKLFDSLGYVPVKRGEPDLNAIKTFITTLKNGGSILIAPEGTRNKIHDGTLMPFKEGAVSLAIKTKTPIVPIYIYHPRNKNDKIIGITRIVVGETITFDDFYDKPITKDKLSLANELLFAEFSKTKKICEKSLNKVK